MNIEEVRLYALSLPGTTEDQAYGADWVLFRIEGKIFLHIWLNAPEPTCAVKLPPEQGQTLRDHYDGIRPAYHLNKVHWNDVFLDEIDDDMVKELINHKLIINDKYDVSIIYNKKVYRLEGFIDTGNKLESPISKKSVILVNLKISSNKLIYYK